MNKDTLVWALFVAILCPLFLRQAGDPLAQTVGHVAICLVMVRAADWIELCRLQEAMRRPVVPPTISFQLRGSAA